MYVNDVAHFQWDVPVDGLSMRIMETPTITSDYEGGFLSGDEKLSGQKKRSQSIYFVQIFDIEI